MTVRKRTTIVIPLIVRFSCMYINEYGLPADFFELPKCEVHLFSLFYSAFDSNLIDQVQALEIGSL